MAWWPALCSEGQDVGQEGGRPPVSAHLGEARSEQAGFCSASAAGQQNWCSTVSFLRAEQREKVRAQRLSDTPASLP